MKLKYIFPIILLPLLSGCFGTEPNDTAYVCAIGIDKGSQDNLDITIQFAKPTQISGGSSEEGGKGGESIVENILIEAPDIYSAVNIANHLISKKFSLSHMELIVFSEEIAKEGIEDVMEIVSRSNEMRPDVITAVSQSSANSYLENLKPIIDVNPAKYYQLIFENNDSGGIPKMNGITAMEYLMNDERDIVMPLIGVAKSNNNEGQDNQQSDQSEGQEESNKQQEGQNKADKATQNDAKNGDLKSQNEEKEKENPIIGDVPINNNGFQYKNREYKAGQVKIINEDKSEALGMAVFNKNKYIVSLSGNEADLYNILIGDYKNNYTSFYSPVTPNKPITIILNQRREPTYKIDIENKKIKIGLYMEGDFYSLPFNYNKENEVVEFEKSCAAEISKRCSEFIKNMRDDYNADVIGLGEKAKKYFAENKSYQEYNWREKFKEYDIEVETKFKIRHSGIMYRKDK